MTRYLIDEETQVVRDRFVCVNEKETNQENDINIGPVIINFNNTQDDEDDSDFYEDDDFNEDNNDFNNDNNFENNANNSNEDSVISIIDNWESNLLEIDVKVENDISELSNLKESEELKANEEEIINKDDVVEIISNNSVNEQSIESDDIQTNDLLCIEEDIKVNLFKALSEYFPMNMRLDRISAKEFNETKKGIVIEKLGEEIIAVENLGFIPFYVKGEKENLTVRENSLDNYMEWLKNDVIKRYNNGITTEEFDKIEKLIIIEDESEIVELNSNETYISRAEALDRLSKKYDVVIDLTMNNCHIKFNDNNVNCSIDVEGLGYKIASSTDWVEEISTKLNCFKNKKMIFLGIAGKEKLLKELNEKFNIETKRNFESLAWEML